MSGGTKRHHTNEDDDDENSVHSSTAGGGNAASSSSKPSTKKKKKSKKSNSDNNIINNNNNSGGNKKSSKPKSKSNFANTLSSSTNNNFAADVATSDDGRMGGATPDPIDEKNPNSSIPIFLKKTYRLIESCDPNICSWTEDGDMFVVKDPDLFASTIIPQYFDHNKFSSFARQLNFYGFRKIQTKPIRNVDFDENTARHVTFFNEKFKRGRYDLLKEIQRSTRGGGLHSSNQDHAKEMEALRSTISTLEHRVQELESKLETQGVKIEREIALKVEKLVIELLSSKNDNNNATANGAAAALAGLSGSSGMGSLPPYGRSFGSIGGMNATGSGLGREMSTASGWENPILVGTQAARAFSTASASSLLGAVGGSGNTNAGDKNENASANSNSRAAAAGAADGSSATAQPTLPPHPKQKSLPPPPSMLGMPQKVASRGTSRDGISAAAASLHAVREASMGGVGIGGALGGMNPQQMAAMRGFSTASNSSMMFRNAWEDKFFTTLMMENASRNASIAGMNGYGGQGTMGMGMNGGMGMGGLSGGGGGGGGNVTGLAALAAARQAHQEQQAGYAMYLQNRADAMQGNFGGGGNGNDGGDERLGSLKRQSTAEILLEAAGELGQGGGGGRGIDRGSGRSSAV